MRTRKVWLSRLSKSVAVGAVVLGNLVAGASPLWASTTHRTWNNTGADWATGANWDPIGDVPPGATRLAVFARATTTVAPTLAGAQSALGVAIDNSLGNYDIAGAGTLTIGARGLSMVEDVATTTATANIALGSNQRWTLGTTVNTVFLHSGVLSGGNLLIKDGLGVLVLEGNNSGSSFGLRIDQGTLRIGSGSTNALGAAANLVTLNAGRLELASGTKTEVAQLNIGAFSAANNVEVGAGATLTLSGIMSGSGSLSKGTGTGVLQLDNAGNLFQGTIGVNGGRLELTGTANVAATALRASSVNLNSTELRYTGISNTNVRLGNLNGAGTVDASFDVLSLNSGVTQTVLIPFNASASSSAAIVTDANLVTGTGTGGWTVNGIGTQTLTGNLTGLNGDVTVRGVSTGAGTTTAGLFVGGTGSAANTALTAAGVNVYLQGGTLTLSNTAGNTGAGATTDRLRNAATVFSNGGTLSMLGNGTNGSAESTGSLTLRSGATTISVTHNGGAAGTQLSFSGQTQANRATVNYAGVGGTTFGAAGANPRVSVVGAAGFIGEFATYNGNDYASRAANIIVAPTYNVTWIDAQFLTGTTTTNFETLNQVDPGGVAAFGDVTYQARALRINPAAAGASLDMSGVDFQVNGLLLAGLNNYTISGSATGGISTPTATPAPRYIGVAQANTVLTVGALIRAPGNDVVKYGDGVLELVAANNTTLNTGNTTFVLNAGALRATPGTTLGLTANTSVAFRGGVLQLPTGSTFTHGVGTGGGTVNWSAADGNGSGGFIAQGTAGTTTVNLGGASAIVNWGGINFVQDGHTLVLGSSIATTPLTFTNPINLGAATTSYEAREIRVSTGTARLTGAVTGSSATIDLLKSGGGILELAAANTYAGNTLVAQGTLRLGANNGLPSTTNLHVAAGTAFQTNGFSTVVSSIAGNGTINLTTSGNNLTVSGPGSTTFGGTLTGAGQLTKSGGGVLVLAGAVNNSGGLLINANSTLLLNSTGTGLGSVSVKNGGTFGGNGTLSGATTAISVESGGTFSPGASAGTMIIDNGATLDFQAGSILAMELNGAGAGQFDQIVLGNNGAGGSITPASIGNVTFVGTIAFSPTLTTQIFIIDQQGTQTALNGLFTGVANADKVLLGSYFARVSYFGNSATGNLAGGNDVLLFGFEPTPEPAHIMLLCAAACGAAGFVRRRFLKKS